MSWFSLYAKQLSGERWFQMGSPVSDFRWLLLTGIIVGLLTRKIISGKAYGTVADMLLGITGAFASAWMTEALVSYRTIAWENRLLFAIWGGGCVTGPRPLPRQTPPISESLPRKNRESKFRETVKGEIAMP